MEIRNAEPADVSGIQRVAERSWREAYTDVLGEETVRKTVESDRFYAGDSIRDGMANPERAYLVAVTEDAVVGYAVVIWTDDDEQRREWVEPGECELGSIYVDPDCWGEGVGTALLERGVDAVPDDRDRVKIRVLAENDVGTSFYGKHGCERVGECEIETDGDVHAGAIYALDI